MSQLRVPGFNPLPFILAGIAGLLGILLIGVAVWSLTSGNAEFAEATNTPRPPRIVSLPTSTPVAATATATSTATSTPTATELAPTSEPTELPTATSIPPTDRPAATNPPVPSTATPADTRLANITFSVENPVVRANEGIWFNFSLTNPSPTNSIQLGKVGVVVLQNGVQVHWKESWTGWVLEPGRTQPHRDSVTIGTPGSYQLQLSICWSSVDACQSGAGEWQLVAQPVAITVQ